MSDFEPQAVVQKELWPGNAEGEAKFTRPTMARFIVEDGDLPEMREVASAALEAAGWPKTDRGKVQAILDYARKHLHYVSDAPYRETVYRPRYLWCLKGAKLCTKIGDCGNMNCALGAACRSAGFDVKVQGIEYGGGAQDHVNIVVYLADERIWAEADATVDKPVGHSSGGRKVLYDPHHPSVTGAGANAGAFIGAAKAYDGSVVGSYADFILGRIGAGTILGMHTVHELVDLTNAWDYQISRLDYAVNCARAAGWAKAYGSGEQDAASQWLDQWNDATAQYVVARTDVQTLYKKTTEGGNASGYSWDTDGAYTANAQGQSVDVWAEILNAVAPFDNLDRQLRMKGNPTGFPQQCLPTYPHVPQPTAPDWDLDVYKAITNLPGFEPGAPWYKPLVIAGWIVAGTAVVVGGVYVATKVAPLVHRGARERKLRGRRSRRRMAA